jgi:hypothetical protein
VGANEVNAQVYGPAKDEQRNHLSEAKRQLVVCSVRKIVGWYEEGITYEKCLTLENLQLV